MEKERILEGSKLIAEFVGMLPGDWGIPNPFSIADVTRVNIQFNYEDVVEEWKEDGLSIWDAYRFHTSLDWIFPVINKIGEVTGNELEISSEVAYWNSFEDTLDKEFLGYSYPVEESFFPAVVEFLEWYNENKST